MIEKRRYLTKSRFKLGLECPTKLFYTGKKEYVDTNLEDNFLQALAKGGFQVGELSKLYFPGGMNIDTLDHQSALDETQTLLKRENVVIYEAAFAFEQLFIRADIVTKKGDKIELHEVKAKSYDPGEEFVGSKGGIKSEWRPYLMDVAFQKYVIQNAYPEFKIESYLMLANKGVTSSVDGLNQKFFLYLDDDRNKVKVVGDTSLDSLGNPVLISINVDDIITEIYSAKFPFQNLELSFSELVTRYSEVYSSDTQTFDGLGVKCGSCEFRATNEGMQSGKQSGYHECWINQAKFSESDFKEPHVLKIWNFRKKAEYISKRMFHQKQLTRSDLEPKNPAKHNGTGLSTVDRQAMQIEKSKGGDSNSYFDKIGLQAEMKGWKFPLHFIDFETSAVAIPFTKGRRPYEQIAFQFSHHIVYADGSIEHSGQWIGASPGYFPNYDFVRELKKELEKDTGTIFRYAAHENSILGAIYWQLKNSVEPDRNILCDWITTITKSTGSSADRWEGARNMVDLLELVKKYYYHPMTEGSNSIKHILPAILNESDYLKTKYSQPLYGTAELKSLNFKDHQWIHLSHGGNVKNPYELLTNVFDGKTFEELDNLVVDEDLGITDGGAAMIAYAQMQFTQMSGEERKLISEALLRYCELDTLAMVMIFEAWREWCKH